MRNKQKKDKLQEIIMCICLTFAICCNFIQICVLNARIENLEKQKTSIDCYSEDFYFVGAQLRSDSCKIRGY